MIALIFTVWLLTMGKLGYDITFVDYIFMAVLYAINLASFAIRITFLDEHSTGKNKALNTLSFGSYKKVK